ncbi:helix-turn-helix domain-containing protein [Akkermansiaceae bacterium]|nr:helix-turn-helix domain-containing protein [Akkermansiaceae bacterium]
MNIEELFDGDDASLEETIGHRIKRHRLDLNISQVELSDKAGVARRTITSVENGKGCTLSTLIRLLRAMDKLDLLSSLFQEPEMTPRQLKLKQHGKEQRRKYASKPQKKEACSTWTWGDEETES